MDAVTRVIPDEVELRRRVGQLSLEQKIRLLTGEDFWALYSEPEAGLRRLVLSDGPAGVRGESWDERDSSANVPSATALAATWDTGRVEAIGLLLAREARRKGVDVLLAPTVNLHRTPYAGRCFECFSEDPLLTARIGASYVRGLQRSGVGATVKHFVGNDSETQRMTVDVRIDDRTLRELYLAPFEAIVRDAGAWAVMAAYNGVNGSPMTRSPMLRDILHGEWGYDGLVMSDWTAAHDTEAAAEAALDLAMPGPASVYGPWGEALLKAVGKGAVDEALIDDKVVRILRLAARVGALAQTLPPPGLPPAAPTSHLHSSPRLSWPSRLRIRWRSRRNCGPSRRPASCWPATTASCRCRDTGPRTGQGSAGGCAWPSSGRTPRSHGLWAAAAPPCSRPTRSRRLRACVTPGCT